MRRPKASPPGNFDSLLNTLTNAVGILLILLAVAQLGVGNAVDRIQREVKDTSNEELDAVEKRLTDARSAIAQNRQDLRTLEAAVPLDRKNLESHRKEIARLKLELSKFEETGSNVDAIQKQLDERQNAVKDLEAKIAQSERDAASLKARLEATPLPGPAPEAKIVTLPNPRSAPPNARPLEIVCQHGRVVPYNEQALRKIAQDRINKAESELKTADGIDCEALKALFEDDDIGNGFFRLKVVHDGKMPELVALHREDVGDTVEDIDKVTSLFRDTLRDVDRRQEWVRFHVFPDSFAVYLAARDVATRRLGMSAGWQPLEADFEHKLSLGLLAGVHCSGYKPTATDAKTPSPKTETKPQPPKPEPKPTDPAAPGASAVPNDDID